MAPKQVPFALTLLARAHSPESTTRIYNERIHQRPLHLSSNDNHIGGSKFTTAQENRRLQRAKKRLARCNKPGKPAPLSSRKARALNLYTIPSSAQKYEIFIPLHRLWIAYIQEILWDGKEFFPITGAHAAKLCSADFHGAELEVVRSRCVGRVGVKGIVVKDSRAVFELVTRENKLKVIPKEGTVFRFRVLIPELPSQGLKCEDEQPEDNVAQEEKNFCTFELHGDQFRYRAVDRANRKFKPHFLPNL
ncbi:hypothetical protein K3495_g310 [Podosphaera aphanis]|nr:hypothetical protein K3495_g310 [Podosphaera aphanis]